MKRYLGTALVGIVCFALGVAFQRFYDARRAPTQAPVVSTAQSVAAVSRASAPARPRVTPASRAARPKAAALRRNGTKSAV